MNGVYLVNIERMIAWMFSKKERSLGVVGKDDDNRPKPGLSEVSRSYEVREPQPAPKSRIENRVLTLGAKAKPAMRRQ